MNVPRKIANRSTKFLGALPMYDVDGINNFREHLKEIDGVTSIRIRGRHNDRKSVLGSKWSAGTQNDIPWRKAQWVAFYAR